MSVQDSLAAAQARAGAVSDDGCPAALPRHFGDVRGEYIAACTGAALFDASDRAQLELTGRDRAKFLHNFCTNDVRGLAAGSGCEAFVANVQGKVLGQIFVFAGEQALWAESTPGSGPGLVAHFSKYQITEDVEFHDRTPGWGELLVCGPHAAQVLAEAGLSANGLGPLQHRAYAAPGGAPVSVRRHLFPGENCYAVVAPRPSLGLLWDQLVKCGAHPAGVLAFEPLRIAARMPLFGRDITPDNLVQEAGRTAQAVSFSKGCYLGQEPIARIDALGHVNQELRGVRLPAGPLPAAGADVSTNEAHSRVVGRITSAAVAPDDGRGLALAYVRRGYNAVGMSVQVASGDGFVTGTLF